MVVQLVISLELLKGLSGYRQAFCLVEAHCRRQYVSLFLSNFLATFFAELRHNGREAKTFTTLLRKL
jgi:hypothetical protein